MNAATQNFETIIYSYTDCRECLTEIKNNLSKQGDRPITYTLLASETGLSSRTKLKKMFKGELVLPKKVLEKLGDFFGLTRQQKHYLDMLRLFNATENSEKASSLYDKILAMKKKHGPPSIDHKLSEVQLKLLDKWYYLPILTYLGMTKSSSDTLDIMKAFMGQISHEDVISTIKTLVEIDLLEYSPTGNLIKKYDHVSILDGLPRPLVKKFHSMMITKAHDSITGMPMDKRYLMSSTLSVKSCFLPEIKQKISKFILKLNSDYSVNDGNSLYQVNIQLFNLANLD